jgi:hypothetical protein
MHGALRDRTTADNLMLAQSERMEPQNFLQLAHGQPLLWQRESPHSIVLSSGRKSHPASKKAGSSRHGCPALRSNLMPITIPNYSRKPIGFSSEY